MARAGLCSACGTNVWLTEQGGCMNGHGPEYISGIYEAGEPQPVQTPVTVPRKTPTCLIVALVTVALFLCMVPILVAIAIPVFNAASNSARARTCYSNQRTIEGASEQWLAESPDNVVEALDGDAWESILVDTYLVEVPVCPSGNEYSLTAGVIDPCSDHGRYSDEF